MPLTKSLWSGLAPEHAKALSWINSHAGQKITWFKSTGEGQRLITQQPVYKPKGWIHTLTIRLNLDGPYADSVVSRRPDGSWLLRYAEQEAYQNGQRINWPNDALAQCMKDGVPVGVLRQVSKIPSEYEIVGLALVVSRERGYFQLQGLSPSDPRL